MKHETIYTLHLFRRLIRAKFNVEFQKKATGKLSAKPNPNLKNFALNYALVLLHNGRLGYILPDNAQIILGKN